MSSRRLRALVAAGLLLGACGAEDGPSEAPLTRDEGREDVDDVQAVDDDGIQPAGEQQFPDVVDAVATPDGDDTWSFDVTLSSPYDTPQRYADAWRVLAPDGTELGVRELTHDHADEQPFTRSLGGVVVPSDVMTVTIEGRDRANGWGGDTVTIDLERG